MYKPESYPDVSPYLLVPDVEEAIAFAEQAFGAVTLRAFRDDRDRINHAEIRIGDSVVMLGQFAGGPEAHVHVYMEYPDDAFLRAVSAGADIVQELTLREDGDRRGGVRDGSGTTWWLSHQP